MCVFNVKGMQIQRIKRHNVWSKRLVKIVKYINNCVYHIDTNMERFNATKTKPTIKMLFIPTF